MRIYVLFGKRFGAKDDVFEALEAIDQVSADADDGIYLHEKKYEWKETGEFDVLMVIGVTIDPLTLKRHFDTPIIPGHLDMDDEGGSIKVGED